jgi:hypothetical protein
MDLADVQRLTAEELGGSIDDLGLRAGWALGDEIRSRAVSAPGSPCLPDPPGRRVQAFQNLVVGTLTERVFRERYLAALEAEGFVVQDLHERGENRDYAVQRDGAELPINVKVASTIFRNAREVVGLDPNDCIPISAYKAIGASERVHNLVYVDLVDFSLREKVDAYMNGLDGSLGALWHLLSWYAGIGAKAAQDQYITALFERRLGDLMGLLPGATSFRVISAQRVLAIMRKNPRRVPGLGIKAAGTGVIVAEVNVHISVRDETRAWTDVIEEARSHGIQHVLDQIARTITAEVPDPLL